jgi:hypothetical protein
LLRVSALPALFTRPSACHTPAMRLSPPGLGYPPPLALVLRALRTTRSISHKLKK